MRAPACEVAPIQLGEARGRALSAYGGFVDAVLPLFGVGPVLDLGAAEPAVLDAWRWRGIDASAADVTADPERVTRLPYENDAFQSAMAVHVLEHVAPESIDAAIRELARVTKRQVFVRVATRRTGATSAMRIERPRAWWEAKFFQAGFGKHPLHQQLTPYATLEHDGPEIVMAFERLPAPGATRFTLELLRDERDLHMDMLRESGRRADAHVARYMFASEFVRPRDRVLDAACGLGYGAALVNDATRAESVVGVDSSAFATDYAQAIFGVTRPRVSFVQDDVRSIERLADGSLDVVISFETLEHIIDPRAFVRDAARVLTPGGRLICSIPNQWLDETGRDPNPHHLHVFDAHTLLALFDGAFHVERLVAQTAGGGMKHHDAPRALVDVDPAHPAADPEWWLVVAMKTPLRPTEAVFREPESAHPDAPAWNVTAIERDYDNPWLVRAIVTRGFRASSSSLLNALAADVAHTARAGSPDRGAALCVQAYAVLHGEAPPMPGLTAELEAYCAAPPGSPHVERWRISNEYVLARLLLQQGFARRAEAAFARCAERDWLVYGPLIATKTVDAAFWAGWLSFQRGDAAGARRWWARGVGMAHVVVGGSWTDVIGSVEEPLLFGLHELTQVLDSASRCAGGLHALAGCADRPGLVASLAFQSMGDQLHAHREVLRRHEAELGARDRESLERAAEQAAEIDRLREACRTAEGTARDLQILLRQLRDPRGVAVFGAGEGGRRFAARWQRAGGTVACFSDNRADLWGSRIEGAPVIPPRDLAGRDVALVVIASSPGYHQIAAQLADLRLPAALELVNGAVFTP